MDSDTDKDIFHKIIKTIKCVGEVYTTGILLYH